MIIALDREQKRLHIEDALAKQEYFCPCCGEQLLQRRGMLRRHHFAHYPGKHCSDSWAGEYDMSEWHFEWQNRFPKENQEIVLSLGEIRHRADALIGRTVVEFQKSALAEKTFQDRNSFYINLGHKVIWVFDLSEQFSSGSLSCGPDRKTFRWIKPNNAFRVFQLRTGQTEIFFQLRDEAEPCLVKVAGLSARGFEQFTVSGWYGKEEFLAYLGVRDGICPPPEFDGPVQDPEYLSFREKYGIRLNQQQERAVQAVSGANLLLAVPGSGKTTVLVARLGYMILCRNIPPEKILAMTFSKQAARDMQSRFRAVFGPELAGKVQFRTIHSVAGGILRAYEQYSGHKRPELLDDNRQLVTQILREHQQDYPSDSEIAEAAAAITYIKNLSIPVSEIPKQGFAVKEMEKVYARYQGALSECYQMDFDDQVGYAVRILKRCPPLLQRYRERYPYICVDEAQDTSRSQHELLRLLAGEQGNIFLVGDEDQSIYRFRGAYPQALLDFKDSYPNPYILWMETNYRSTPQIVAAVVGFIERNQNRYPKNMTAHREQGGSIRRIELPSRGAQYRHLLEAAKQKPASTAILYRDNDSAVPLISLLNRNGIPYRCPKREYGLFTSRITRDVTAFMVFLQDQKNVEAFRHICYKGSFYLDKNTVEIACRTVQNKNITFVQALQEQAKRFPKIREAAAAFDSFCRTASCLKARTLLHYLDSNGYGAYMQKNQMDRNAFELLLELAADDPPVPEFLRQLEQLKQQIEQHADGNEGMILSTVHSAKGLEYDTVYIMDLYDGRFPGAPQEDTGGRRDDMDTNEEERRLFYVAMTRARDHLFLLTLKGRESSFAEEVVPLPKPQRKPGPVLRPQPQIPYEQLQAQRREALRKKQEAEQIARKAEQERMYRQGLEEVQGRSFLENEIVLDSFGKRWIKCDQCDRIGQNDAFSWIGIQRDTPGLGRCTACVRKMK